ncbi:hypothetical protein K3495_g5123 [Podosphaera aphanis]|nr:hypothetical protein K3495_g5123 [Podosphaera aphanis]
MTTDEYTPVVRGPLKLKGSGPVGITKKKKKKKKKAGEVSSHGDTAGDASKSSVSSEDVSSLAQEAPLSEGPMITADAELAEGDGMKTASERAYEEMRRRRLHDRLLKEGLKSHKQRVEELNKYLSNLSEHHDMPRIGPG